MKKSFEKLKNANNWREKIILRVFRKEFFKIYRQGLIDGFNWNF